MRCELDSLGKTLALLTNHQGTSGAAVHRHWPRERAGFLGANGASSREGLLSASEGSVFTGGTCASAGLAGGDSALGGRGHAVADPVSRPLASARVEEPLEIIRLPVPPITRRHSEALR
jgi:hypothetical protein